MPVRPQIQVAALLVPRGGTVARVRQVQAEAAGDGVAVMVEPGVVLRAAAEAAESAVMVVLVVDLLHMEQVVVAVPSLRVRLAPQREGVTAAVVAPQLFCRMLPVILQLA